MNRFSVAEVLGLVVAASCVTIAAAQLPECTLADKRYLLTPCHTETNTMTSVEYFARACAETATVTLRDPIPTACNVACPSGTFLSARTVQCESCPKGHFSNSGGLAITNFKQLPDMVTTYCRPQPCQPWVSSPSGSIFSSGNQSVGVRHIYDDDASFVDESVESTFTMIINVINPRGGKLIFKYRVESERFYDGLVVFVNGTAMRNPKEADLSSFFWLSGFHQNWRTAEIPLPWGRTAVRLSYMKDMNQNSPSGDTVGEDRAFIRDLVIEGVQMFASECTPCPAGSYMAEEGKSECIACPRNFSSTRGAERCDVCPASTWSPPGSATCVPRVPCDDDDWVPVYGPCDSQTGKRTRTWKLTNGRCLPDGSVRKVDDTVSCTNCLPGTFPAPDLTSCIPCPVGSALVNGKCTECSAGTAAIPTIDFSNGFDTFGGTLDTNFFNVDCTGICDECPNGGWCKQVGGDAFEVATFPVPTPDGKSTTTVGIRNSMTNGNYFTSNLRYPFTAVSDGVVRVRYMFFRPYATPDDNEDDFSASMLVDGKELRLDPYYNSYEQVGTAQLNFKKGETGKHEFVITYSWSVSWNTNPSPVAIVILGVEVVGDSRGSALKCQVCPAGYYCPAGTTEFVPCPAGSYSPLSTSSSCLTCPDERVSLAPGSSSCMACPPGTRAFPFIKDRCVNLCQIRAGGAEYDLRPLQDYVFGPIFAPGADPNMGQSRADATNTQRYFLSPCSHMNDGLAPPGFLDVQCRIHEGKMVESTYGCQRINANRSYSIGDFVTYDVSRPGQVSMLFSGGDNCHQPEAPRRSNVTLMCDPDPAARPGVAHFISEEPRCTYNFQIKTNYACPACTADSYMSVDSECQPIPGSNLQNRKVTWVRRVACYGGVPPPNEMTVVCQECTNSSYIDFWTDCVDGIQERNYVLKPSAIGCIPSSKPGSNVMNLLQKEKRKCTTIEVRLGENRFTAGVVLIVLGLTSLSVALVVVVMKHKKLSAAYDRLSSSAAGHEMPEIPSGERETEELEKNNQAVATTAQKNGKGRAVVIAPPANGDLDAEDTV